MVVMDPPEHTKARSLLSRLLTPARLKENEDFMGVGRPPARGVHRERPLRVSQ